MMRCLVFISLLLFMGCTSRYLAVEDQGKACDVSFAPVSDTTMIFNALIGIQEMSVSGVIILQRVSEDKIRFILLADAGPTLIDLDLEKSRYSKNYVFKKLDRKVILDLFYQDLGIVTGIFSDTTRGFDLLVDSFCCYPLKRTGLLCYETNENDFPVRAVMSSKKKRKTSVSYYYSNTGALDSITVEHHCFDMNYTLYIKQ